MRAPTLPLGLKVLLAVLLVLVVFLPGCAGMRPNNIYAVNYNEFASGAQSGVSAFSNGTQQPLFNAPVPQFDAEGNVIVPQEQGEITANGLLINAGTFTRSADMDMAAAIQQLRNLDNSTGGMETPQGVGQSQATGQQSQTQTVDDADTIAPQISVPLTGQGSASVDATQDTTTTPDPVPTPGE